MPCAEESEQNCSVVLNEAVYNCEVKSVEYYGYIYFYTPVTLAGIVLNMLNLKLLTGSYFKNCGPTFTFLTAKAVADLLFLVFASPIGIVRCAVIKHAWQMYSRQIYDIYIYTPIGHSFSTASVWLTAVVSVERYITVVHTSIARKVCTKDLAQWTILFVCVLAVAINLPYFFYRCISDDNTRVYTIFASSLGFKIYSWCRTLFIKYIPITIVIIFNMMLLGFVYRSTKKKKTTVFPQPVKQSRQKLQSRVTTMLLGMTIMFVFCHVLEPFIHAGIYRSLFGYCSVYTHTFRDFRMVVKFLETTSYASSFVFYCIFNKEFANKMNELCDSHTVCCKRIGVNASERNVLNVVDISKPPDRNESYKAVENELKD